MLEKKVKSLFGNLIAVQGKYVDLCLELNQDLKLVYKNDYMLVAHSQLDKPIRTIDVPDKFNGKLNKLYYYHWKPIDKNQKSLWQNTNQKQSENI
jgi:hypothetical protein|tara:strand:+ start:6251 stop:6535 length:285 start_codon:yes stop_codon:yes gene_type:complete